MRPNDFDAYDLLARMIRCSICCGSPLNTHTHRSHPEAFSVRTGSITIYLGMGNIISAVFLMKGLGLL